MPTTNLDILKQFFSDGEVPEFEDQRGLRSWLLEPYLELHNDAANAALNIVLTGLCVEWLDNGGHQRKPNLERQKQFKRCLQVFLLNFMRLWTIDKDMVIRMRSGRGQLDAEMRYRPEFLSVRYYLKARDFLLEHDLICVAASGYQYDGLAQLARYALTEKGVRLLPMSEITITDFKVGKPDEVIYLKDKDKNLAKYTDNPKIDRQRKNVERINTVLSRSSIKTTRTPVPAIDFDDDFEGWETTLYRVFNNGRFSDGGRFYGGWWQRVKRGFRQCITIDGEPTVEADFKALHPTILFIKAGQTVPLDPYAIVPGVDGNKELREHAKSTFNALVNTIDMRTKEPRNFDSEKHGMSATEFRQLVAKAYPMLPGIFGSGTGVRLQREDSDLAERIMLHFVDQRIPILPVHDSFIVQSRYRQELENIMKQTFRETYGFSPTVTVKISENQ